MAGLYLYLLFMGDPCKEGTRVCLSMTKKFYRLLQGIVSSAIFIPTFNNIQGVQANMAPIVVPTQETLDRRKV